MMSEADALPRIPGTPNSGDTIPDWRWPARPRAGERTGRPLGSAGFIASLEQSLGRSPQARPEAE
jgi:hypothetical protein